MGAEVSVVLTGLIGTVDWAAARSMLGGSAFVPESLARLLRAESDEEAEAAYWELDNRVVVQGQLFDAARLLVGPLVSALQTRLAPSARRQVVDLLVEIALGTPDQSELLLGNEELAAQCRREIERGLWCFYGLLDDGDARVRMGAVDVLDAVESDRGRLSRVMLEVSQRDPDSAVRSRASEVGPGPVG